MNLPRGLALSATQTIRIHSLTEGVVFLSSLSLPLSLPRVIVSFVLLSLLTVLNHHAYLYLTPDPQIKQLWKWALKREGHSCVWPEGRIPNPEAQSNLASNKGRDLCECKNTSTFEIFLLGGVSTIYPPFVKVHFYKHGLFVQPVTKVWSFFFFLWF